MKVRNKIGFHCGPGGNRTGINTAPWGGWMTLLTQAGIPFFLKSTDDYGPLSEAVQHIKSSGVAHTLVYRLSTAGQNDGFSYDVPDYDASPEAAAASHWERTVAKLPAEYDKTNVWLEPVNEVDRARADWLGRFAVHIADLAQNDGYKVTLFGWSSGEPEPEDWETPGMLAYLRLCGRRPEQAAVALHEYSFDKNNLQDGFPFKVGRFRFLFAVCDRHQIPRPTVHITEWGWEYQSVPEPAKALEEIGWAATIYGPHPQIKGAAVWHLGKGGQFGDIANQAQRLIEPLARMTVDTEFELETEMHDLALSPAEFVDGGMGDGSPAINRIPGDNRAAAEIQVSNSRYLADVNFADFSRVDAGSEFTKRWRIQNNGQSTWDRDFNLVHVPDEANGSVRMATKHNYRLSEVAANLPVEPGQEVEIAVPMIAPDQPRSEAYFSDWRLQDAAGNLFGDFIYVKIVAVQPADPARFLQSDSTWLADLTIEDGSQIEAGQSFTKRWLVKNSGRRRWGPGFNLVFVSSSDTAMTGTLSHPLPLTHPGEEAVISLDLVAPLQPRPEPYVSMWRMQDDHGHAFGDRLWLEIRVVATQRPLPMTVLSQIDPRWKNAPLGDGTRTIGEFGCLLTTFAMIASAYGHEHTPLTLNDLINQPGGPAFFPGSITPFRVLQDLFADIRYDGRFTHRLDVKGTDPANIQMDPLLISRIDAALAQGNMVVAQVDSTPATPYNHATDQHWVLLIARNGGDYLAVDAANGQQISLLSIYGRQNHRVINNLALRDAILSALFYRSTRAGGGITPIVDDGDRPGTTVLQTGVNVNPDAPHSNPHRTDELKGLDWVRFVFKIDAQPDPRRRNIQSAFEQFDPIIGAYAAKGVSSLLVLNQETVWGNAPWDNGNWGAYADQLADAAGQIAAHYRHLGDRVAYEIWNEGDLPNNPSSVFVQPEDFAAVLLKTTAVLRPAAPDSALVLGGLASGPGAAIPYLKRCLAAMGGRWPVDAIGIHPYGRWATRAPFDWGQQFGTLAQAFQAYKADFPDIPFWITEIGVAADSHIGPEHYATIADYIKDVYSHVGERHVAQVPVLIWFGWSDWMRNAGIVDHDGRPKQHVFAAFEAVRDRRLPGL